MIAVFSTLLLIQVALFVCAVLHIARFCQAYMSAMTKFIGTEVDYPSMGSCVGGPEIGYLYGQVKRGSVDHPNERTTHSLSAHIFLKSPLPWGLRPNPPPIPRFIVT